MMKYFTELKLSGYKSIKDVTLKLGPGINILIGPNGSGKSNLLTFISHLRNDILDIDSEYKVETKWISGKESFEKVTEQYFVSRPKQLSMELGNDLRAISKLKVHKYFLSRNGEEVVRHDNIGPISNNEIFLELFKKIKRDELLDHITYIQFVDSENVDFLSHPKSVVVEVEDAVRIFNSRTLFSWLVGNVIFQSFDSKKVDNKTVFRDFEQLLEPYVEQISKFSPVRNITVQDSLQITKKKNKTTIENIQFLFELEDGWYSWDDLSDGTKRMISIISNTVRNTGVTLIEEPELGVHPHQLSLILDFLREQSEYKQIILTTHSPDVLDVLPIDSLEKINLVSNKKGSTVVRKLTQKQKQKAFDYYEELGTIGDYWKHSDLE